MTDHTDIQRNYTDADVKELADMLCKQAGVSPADGPHPWNGIAESLLASGRVTVTPPPAPTYEPGQLAWVRMVHGNRDHRAYRQAQGCWLVLRYDGRATAHSDEEISDVRRVAVLDAHDVEDLAAYVGAMLPGPSPRGLMTDIREAVCEFFEDEGVSSDD